MTFAYSGNDMQDMTTNIQLTMITAMAAAERKTKIIELLEQGLSVREVAMKVGCNPSTVQRTKKIGSI